MVRRTSIASGSNVGRSPEGSLIAPTLPTSLCSSSLMNWREIRVIKGSKILSVSSSVLMYSTLAETKFELCGKNTVTCPSGVAALISHRGGSAASSPLESLGPHWVFKAPTPTSSSARRGRTAQHHIVQRATAVGHSEPELVTDPGANDDLVTVAKARPDQDRYVIDELVREEVADAGPYRDIQRRRPRRRLGSESRNESHPSRALRRATIGGRGHRPRSLRREAAP